MPRLEMTNQGAIQRLEIIWKMFVTRLHPQTWSFKAPEKSGRAYFIGSVLDEKTSLGNTW
jgi:hypothetical protein